MKQKRKCSVALARELRYNVYMNMKLFVKAMRRDFGIKKADAEALYKKAK